MIPRETEPSLFHPACRGVRLSSQDSTDGWQLSTAAGWNQTECDWEFLLRTGHAFGFETSDGRLVASTVVTPYSHAFSWVSMVLVAAEFRQQGLAAALLRHALALAEPERRTTLLDATPAGRKVYAALGFRDLYGITRWLASDPLRARSSKVDPRVGLLGEVEPWIAWDALRFGSSRETLLRALTAERPDLALRYDGSSPAVRGFCLGRPGRVATQIGPVVADTVEAAHALLSGVLDRVTGPFVCDLVDGRVALADELTARGFVPQRPFTRMACGAVPAEGITTGEFLYATAGPELG